MRKCFIIGCMYGVAAAILQGAGGAVVSVVRADARTGRLVRTVVAPSTVANPRPRLRLTETVDRIAQQNQLSPQLVHSVIQVESNYDPNAVSPKGAQGLMQLIPSTARRFGVSDAFDPADNIQGGARYLKYLLGLYKGDEVAGAGCLQCRRRRGFPLWRRAARSRDAELRGQGAAAPGGRHA